MAFIVLPDALSSWPWPRRINPCYDEVKAEADNWIHSMKAFDAKAQKAFDKCDFALLAALCYPRLDRRQLRVACELMMLFFVFDEFTDKVDGDGVQLYVDMVVDALEHPRTPSMEEPQFKLREVTRQFWLRATSVAPVAACNRFKKTFVEYINAVVFEAQDRRANHIRSIESYLELRRLTAGGYPSLFPVDMAVDIPDEVMQYPTLIALNGLVAESLILLNDVYSYNIEQASGHHAHNLVTVVMHEHSLPVQGALEWIASYHADCLARFRALADSASQAAPELESDIARYVQGLAEGIRGIDAWCFESQRYFGAHGPMVRQTRLVALLPRVSADIATPMTVAEVEMAPELAHPAGVPLALQVAAANS